VKQFHPPTITKGPETKLVKKKRASVRLFSVRDFGNAAESVQVISLEDGRRARLPPRRVPFIALIVFAIIEVVMRNR
jgi:hypothetical protein